MYGWGFSPSKRALHTLVNTNVSAFPVFNVFTERFATHPIPRQPGHKPATGCFSATRPPDPTVLHSLSNIGIQVRIEQTPTYLVLELHRVMHGRLTAEVLGPAGTIIDIGWDEKLYQGAALAGLHRPLPFPDRPPPSMEPGRFLILDGNYRELTTLDARTGRYILITIWGMGPGRTPQPPRDRRTIPRDPTAVPQPPPAPASIRFGKSV